MNPLLLKARDTLDCATSISYSFNRIHRNFAEIHTHDFYEISIVTAGMISHQVNRRILEVPSNTLIFIRPQDAHCMVGTDGGKFEYVNIAFSTELLDLLIAYLDCGERIASFSAAPLPPAFRLSASQTAAFRQSLEQISLIPETDVDRIKTCSRRFIGDLIAHCCLHAAGDLPSPHRWFNQLLEELNQPEIFSGSLSWLSERSGKSTSYISRMFRQYLHTTPTDYINALRLNYCANHLTHSDTPIIDIAMNAGFNNLSHFYHLFRQAYGTSPHRFRVDNGIRL